MRHRHGLTLTELLMTLSLAVFFLNLSGRLFHESMQSSLGSQTVENQTMRIDAAIAKLREDVWEAGAIAVTDANWVKLSRPDGGKVIWKLDTDGSLLRTDGQAVTRWPIARSDWRFSDDGTTLTITATDHHETHELRLVSQVLLASRGAP